MNPSNKMIGNKIIVSIIIVTYNNENDILDCINSLFLQSFRANEIIIVDNSPNNNTVDLIMAHYPSIKVIKNYKNLGYGAGNNIGVNFAHGEYIAILNPDTIVTSSWLEELLKPLILNEKLITTSKILTKDGCAINTCGNIIHFTGMAFTRGYGTKSDAYPKDEFVGEFSGCSFAIKKDLYLKLNGFDENIFLYHDDVDFSIRAQVNGIKILYVSRSIVFHNYELTISPQKLYFLEKGRYFILKKYLKKSEIALILPSLFMTEILTSCYAVKLGKSGIIMKLKAIRACIQQPMGKNEGEGIKLLNVVTSKIPENQLITRKWEYLAIVFINVIYELNYKILLKVCSQYT